MKPETDVVIVGAGDPVDQENEFALPCMATMAAHDAQDIDQTSATDRVDSGGGSDFPVLNGSATWSPNGVPTGLALA